MLVRDALLGKKLFCELICDADYGLIAFCVTFMGDMQLVPIRSDMSYDAPGVPFLKLE